MASKKQIDILNEIRQDIVSGKLAPGAAVPSRDELLVRFGSSRQTLQTAMNTLIRDGFITARRFGGTVVAGKPPHLYQYGLVSFLPFSSTRYTVAMQQAASKLSEEGAYAIKSYYYEQGHIQAEGFRRLIADVESHRVAGLIFALPPDHLAGTPAMEQPGLPLVLNGSPKSYSHLHHFHFAGEKFLERAVDHLIRRGRRKIAVMGVYHANDHQGDLNYLLRRKVGRPEWMQSCGLQSGSAHQVALLLAKLSGEDRPDALIIRDDNLVEAATEGLAKSGLRIPQDLEVLAHCNFPDRAPSCVPVTRLGLDCRDMIIRDVECLKAQREGRLYPQNTELPVVFEWELDSKGAANRRRKEVAAA